jgi:hypothetical protein
MKRSMSPTFFAAVVLACLPLDGADSVTAGADPGRAGKPAKQCSLATLQGTYLITARLDSPGYAPMSGVPQVVAALRDLDGAGNSTGVGTVNAGGTILQNQRATGVYTLNADCTGTMTNAGSRHYDIFVAPDGSEGVGIRTDAGAVEIMRFKRVSRRSED